METNIRGEVELMDLLFRNFNDPQADKRRIKIQEWMAVPKIKKVYFNKKHTTIEWEDGVKTTVGCMDGQEFDEYSGFAAAIAKRLFGSPTAAIRIMNDHKEVQPDSAKKAKKKALKEDKADESDVCRVEWTRC